MIALREDFDPDDGLTARAREMFAAGGLLGRARNFEFRPEQQQLAVSVARALSDGRHLVAEAGTGVGKSLAYLAPAVVHALETKQKAVVSTHTINLQEQLIYKDIPILQKLLPEGRRRCSRGGKTTSARAGCSAPARRRATCSRGPSNPRSSKSTTGACARATAR